MTKLDINGNTVSKDNRYLKQIIRNMIEPVFEIDSANRYMVQCGDGGSIRFFGEDEPSVAGYLHLKGKEV